MQSIYDKGWKMHLTMSRKNIRMNLVLLFMKPDYGALAQLGANATGKPPPKYSRLNDASKFHI
jgi:hypothetical protein